MMKLFLLNIFNLSFPMILNFLMLLLISIPMKVNKFHPLKLMIMLILMIFIISLKMNLFFKSWMSFFVFLIMIGGLMIIFMYITSLSNNTLMKLNLKNIFINFIKFFILTLVMYISIEICMIYFNFNDLLSLNINYNEELNDYSLMKLFNINNNSLIFIMLYLYFSLICIMNICYKLKSPLRQINYYE